MDILILGGGGFLSGTVCRTALSAGHRVWSVSRTGKGLPRAAVPLLVDRNDGSALLDVLQAAGRSWDLAVDCVGFEARHARQDVDVVARFAGHLAFVSTDAVFAHEADVVPKDESFSVFERAGYGRAKRDCEEVFLASDPDTNWTVFRPSHVYGPGSELGCLPMHLRDPDLARRIMNRAPITLVDGGRYSQQPVLAEDLATMILSCVGNPAARREIFMSVGPELFDAATYYRAIGTALERDVDIAEMPASAFARLDSPFAFTICNRAYSMRKAAKAGLAIPATPFSEGLALHLDWILARERTRG
jgi:nucleoside-diphosphate-sugar epimerase